MTQCYHIALSPFLTSWLYLSLTCALSMYTLTAGVQGVKPLDIVLENNMFYIPNGDVALYLINHGNSGDEERVQLLTKACLYGWLNVVKELVEQYKFDPNGECVLN